MVRKENQVHHKVPTKTLPETSAVLKTAQRVLRAEGEAVLRMSENLPSDFPQVVQLLLSCKGRVILSGIGKSGHIARKISSTFASTGTPSSFVHPSEASHGDLGMVTEADVCILISNSGETSELGDLITHTRRFSIPLVGISRDPESTLMRAADLQLTLPAEPEACSIGMAPTTSTTLTLALGDALAVALMEERGFVKENFRDFHPGGKLGSRLAKVHQLMEPKEALPLVREDEPMNTTVITMSGKGFGIACVVDAEGRLAGVISDGDLRRNIAGLFDKKASDIATRTPHTAPPDMLAAEAVHIMNAKKVTALVVIDEDRRPIGLIRLHECLRAGVA